MELRRFAEVGDFLEAAGPFLAAREAEHNLILGVTSNLREAPEEFSASPYLATVSAADRIVAVAMQTPPFNLVLSEIDDPAAIACLADDLVDRDLPGALGPVEYVRAFVEARTARGGAPARLHISERIFRLTEVRPPTTLAPGSLRAAEPADRELVSAWIGAFHREALEPVTPSELAALTDRWLGGHGRTIYLWEDGEVVSLAGIGSPTPNGLRIGPVYTPPERRRRGYASALVAAMSQAALDAGRRFCFLFTDLANPTSNHVYQSIGYEPVRDVDVWWFGR
jgi:predicted GNAT family acetyltransferase